MQVFKLFLKLIKNTSTPIILITAMFIIYLFVFMDKGNNATQVNAEVYVAVIDPNQEDAIGEHLKSIIGDYSRLYAYNDDEELLEEQITTLNIDAIITIPYGFSKDLMSGREVVIEYQKITNNRLILYIEDITNLYINTAQMYVKDTKYSSGENLIELMNKTFESKGDYRKLGQRETLIDYQIYEKYFKIAVYVVFTVCLLGTGMALHSFQNVHIQRRNLMSPLSVGFRNIQMFFGNLIFVILYDVFLIIASFLYYAPPNMDVYLFLFWINLIVFSVSGLSMSYLIAMLTKKREVNILLALLLPFILCSISGVFTSQSEIGEAVLNIAYFTPTYWFVKGNTMIMNSAYGQMRIFQVVPIILTQGLFGVAFFSIVLVASKEKKNNL